VTENANPCFGTTSALVRLKYLRAFREVAGNPSVRFNASLWRKSWGDVGRERAVPSILNNDGLLTPKMAARSLGISVKTLTAHADDGEIRYINVGRGKKNKRRKYTRADLEEFNERRARRDVKCQSINTKRARTTTSISSTEAGGFMALRAAQANEKLKRSNGKSGSGRNSKPR
jgi:Helix-turn-helix domain